MQLDCDAAEKLLYEWTEGDGLRAHARGVEACMRAYARKYEENEELWGITGLLHDLDYEKHPSQEEHPQVGCQILKEKGYPEQMLRAILGHADYLDVPRESRMAQALFAVDELVGFITAVALVRPSRDIREVQPKSVKKKWKDKAFARGVNREDIEKGAEELGIPLADHISFTLEAMKTIASELSLDGSRSS